MINVCLLDYLRSAHDCSIASIGFSTEVKSRLASAWNGGQCETEISV